jgi:hypothetical protein
VEHLALNCSQCNELNSAQNNIIRHSVTHRRISLLQTVFTFQTRTKLAQYFVHWMNVSNLFLDGSASFKNGARALSSRAANQERIINSVSIKEMNHMLSVAG